MLPRSGVAHCTTDRCQTSTRCWFRPRTKKFYVGSDFDPVKVGVDTSCNSGRLLLDTTLLGNSNAGRSRTDRAATASSAPLLTDKERWSLVEYLKSIPEEPGRVTPFGGPTETTSSAAQPSSSAQPAAWK